MANQLSAITGRYWKPNEVEMINAQTPYLQQEYQTKKSNEYNDKALALQEKTAAENAAIAREQLELQKATGKKSNLLGLAGLGVQGYLGMQDKTDEAGRVVETVAPAVANYDIDAATGLPTTEMGGLSLAKIGSGFKDAGTNLATWGSGGVGALAGNLLGDEDRPLEQAAIGGAVGAATSWLQDGDIYSNVLSGVLGAGGSVLDDLF